MSQQNFRYYNSSNGEFSPTIIETDETDQYNDRITPIYSSPSPIIHDASKPGRSWVWDHMKKDKLNKKIKCLVWSNINDVLKQYTRFFELKTSTTNLAAHLRAEHRFDKNGSLLPLSGATSSMRVQLDTILSIQSQPAQLDPSQLTLQEVIKHKVPLSNEKQDQITSRTWIVNDMQSFNVLKSERFQDILYETDSRFHYPSEDIFKQKLHQAVNYSENCLKDLVNNTLESCLSIAIYIEDCLHKELAKWELNDKCLAGVMDNASSMMKAMRDFEILYIQCTAHTIQLEVMDDLKEVTDLISHAKALNAFLAGRDKY
ncbi:9747_t:CDS:2 [Ambispora gerdemannii]|uniref:9747_t:CDS:1 n=1 Tax=Ambispora gerdemannii TaxID=144530 RepID=A0A9N9B6V4_9GLOM|nr:9747_t:CDS:2 [Ambispora gerdemannii]